jgi:hypothetical protein
MYRIDPNELIKLQQVLRRGTAVKIHDEKKDIFLEAVFDGFSDIECPYRYCQLHPKYPGRIKEEKSCDGFMRWIIKDKEEESCPYLGGLQFTAGDMQVITEIKTKKKNPETGEYDEMWFFPPDYLK